MNEWTDEQIREWVLNECWTYYKDNPGGLGIVLQKGRLIAESPPLERIAEAVSFLQDKNKVMGEISRVFDPEKRGKVNNIVSLKLTTEGIEQMEAQASP